MYSPSAEVRGHGPGQEVLQIGKSAVEIRALEPVGSYAVQPAFSDGHDTGIYSWDYLYELGENQETLWARVSASKLDEPRRASRGYMTTTHFGFEQVPEDERRGAWRASSTRSRSATT